MVKNLPAMQGTWDLSLDWEDLLEEGMTTHSSILARKIPMDRGAWWATVCGVAKSRTRLNDKHSTCHVKSKRKKNHVRKHEFKYFKASTQKTQ